MRGRRPPDRDLLRTMLGSVPPSLLSQLGFYALLPSLPSLLREGWGLGTAWLTGIAMFALSASMRGSAIFLSNTMRHLRLRTTAAGGMGLAAIGFASLTVWHQEFAVIGGLTVAGTGISVAGLAVRVFVAESLRENDRRNTVFAAIQVVANVAAALGPLIGAVALGISDRVLVSSVAGAYAVAALIALAAVPARRPHPVSGRPPLSRRTLVDIATDPAIRRTSLTALVGCFLYAQLFSAISIHLLSASDSPAQRSAVFTVNAVLVIALQGPVSTWVNAGLRSAVSSYSYLHAGVVVFSLAFVILALAGRQYAGVIVAITVFSLGETLFSPMLNTAFADIAGERSTLEAFNIRQLSSAIGESVGTLIGGALFVAVQTMFSDRAYWSAVGAVGLLVAACHLGAALPGRRDTRLMNAKHP